MRVVRLLSVLVLLASAPLRLGAADGVLSGRVVDTAGAPLAGALVTVRNMTTGWTRHLTADQRGEYSLPAVAAGRYQVEASLLGFQTAVLSRLEVGEDGHRVPDIALDVQQVTVATRAATPLRATPGIVTLVSEEEILDSGARDLLDVLRLVPGIAFGMDVEGAVGIGVRGNWAHEGKALLLVDGQEQPELLFSTLQFGRHFPAEIIKRIEIIRGPGSAIYGGNAELTVINVVTRGPADLEGVRLTGSYGQMRDSYGQRRIAVEAGRTSGELGVSASAVVGQGRRSDRVYTDVFGASYDLADHAQLDLASLNVGLEYRGLRLRFLTDRYHTTIRDIFSAIAPYSIPYDFDSSYAEARYELRFGEHFTLTPRLSYRVHRPWRANSPEALALEDEPDLYGGVTYDRRAERLLGSLTGARDTRRVRLMAGVEAYRDEAQDDLPGSTFSSGRTELSFSNVAGFGQVLLRTSVADLTVGARYDDHEQYGSEFVPRVAATRALEDFHVKALFSRAFRAPGLENVNLNPGIEPERTRVVELEVGRKLGTRATVAVNLFDIRIDDPIVYGYDASDLVAPEKYLNFPRTGTRGIEVDLRVKGGRGYLNASYSFYRAHENEVPAYEVPADDDVLLGFPAHKLTLLGSYDVTPTLSVTPSLVFQGRRFGYDRLAADLETPLLREFDATALANVNVLLRPARWPALTVGLAAFNLFDAKEVFVQPYGDGGHAPMPDRSRELLLRVGWAWSRK